MSMKKVIFEGIIIVILFFGLWYLLAQVNWINALHIQKITNKTEEKLGDSFWKAIKTSEVENSNVFENSVLDSLVTDICVKNKIDRNVIKLHIIQSSEVNAFALPNGHLIVFTGLISNCDHQDELYGVLCHEIAHIKLNHIMKKLGKEVGITLLISMTTGNSGSDIIKTTAKKISSTAFDRKMEKEADLKAVDYMIKANVDQKPFAEFLRRLNAKESDDNKYFKWISTHPESKERAAYILEYSKSSKNNWHSLLSEQTWDKLKAIFKD